MIVWLNATTALSFVRASLALAVGCIAHQIRSALADWNVTSPIDGAWLFEVKRDESAAVLVVSRARAVWLGPKVVSLAVFREAMPLSLQLA